MPKPITEKEQTNTPDRTKSETNLEALNHKQGSISNEMNETFSKEGSSPHIPPYKMKILRLEYSPMESILFNLFLLSEKVRAEFFATYGNAFNTQLIDSYLKNNSTLKEKYCSSYQQLKRLYDRLFREFSNISLLNDNLKHFFYTADKIIEYISIENLLSEQFILKEFEELNRELYVCSQRLLQ